jgi:hypothetical protein
MSKYGNPSRIRPEYVSSRPDSSHQIWQARLELIEVATPTWKEARAINWRAS